MLPLPDKFDHLGGRGVTRRCRSVCHHGSVLRRRARIAIVAALGLVLSGPVLARADLVTASVSATPSGQSMPPGFLGVSVEYRALHQYTGRDPRAVNPVLVALLK